MGGSRESPAEADFSSYLGKSIPFKKFKGQKNINDFLKS
jgi:hypothetical protein